MVVAGAIALVALAAVVGSLGWLHVQPTGLSPVQNAVSQYGISAYAVGYRVATIAFASAGVALAVAVEQATQPRAWTTVVLLLVFAAARAAISWFPMDVPGTELTPTGRHHGLLAIAAFGAATAAAFNLGSVLSRQSRWHDLAGTSRILGAIMLATLIAMAVARREPAVRRRFGAIERGFYLGAIAWFAVFSVAAVTAGH
jgi:hypothetical protein